MVEIEVKKNYLICLVTIWERANRVPKNFENFCFFKNNIFILYFQIFFMCQCEK